MHDTALLSFLSMAGLAPEGAATVAITGTDPVLPTRYRVAEAGAAAIAATGLAAALLWQTRTGRLQTVQVDARAAAAAMRSSKYLRIDGAVPRHPRDPVTGFYPVRDGRWVYLHCNFPNLRDHALQLLGAAAERESVAAAVRGWDGPALEDALFAAGACGAFVRTPAEWLATAQAQAIQALPPLEIIRIGAAPPQPLPAGNRPLSGIRVLDLTRVLAGPTCARTLAEHGADVMKIACLGMADSGMFDLDTGLGKLSAFLDLRDPGQAEQLRQFAAGADVFSQAYRPGSLDARGFSPAELARLRPGIVAVSLSAWGHLGPWAGRRGYDTVVQAANGMAATQGDDTPAFLPCSVQDYVAGYLMAFGAMLALRRRATEGGSWLVRVSLAATGRWVTDRGLLDPAAIAGVPPELPEAEIAALSTESASPVGRLQHLAPAARLSETPGHWVRPAVPLGHDAAHWP